MFYQYLNTCLKYLGPHGPIWALAHMGRAHIQAHMGAYGPGPGQGARALSYQLVSLTKNAARKNDVIF